MKHSTLILKL